MDLIWNDQPPRKFNSIISLDLNIAGKTIDSALQLIRKAMRDKHSNLLIVTALDEIACTMFKTKKKYFIKCTQNDYLLFSF